MPSRYQATSTGVLAGLNEDPNPHSLADNELTKADNIARIDNEVGTRPGVVTEGVGAEYENTTTGSNPIQGLHEHLENAGTGRHLLAVGDDDGTQNVFFEDASLLPNLAAITGDNQDNVWTFANHRNLTWAAGGAATDDLWHWDGNTGTGATALVLNNSAAARIRPQYIFSYRNYLLINGMRGAVLADDNPAASRFCQINVDPTVAANWNDADTLGFNAFSPGPAFGNDYTTGFGEYVDNDGSWLLVLANKGIHSYQLDPANFFSYSDSIANGCVSQRAFVSLGLDSGDAIYMSRFGFHSLRQSQAEGNVREGFLSWKIRTTFASLNQDRLQFSVGAYDQVNGRVVFAVSTGANTAHDLLLVLDVKDEQSITSQNARWYKWRLNGSATAEGTKLSVNEMKFITDENGEYFLYIGTIDGRVLRFDETVFGDIGTSYRAELQTKHKHYGTMLGNETLGDVMLTATPGGAYKPTYTTVFDYGAKKSAPKSIPWQDPGTFKWNVSFWGAAKWSGEVQQDTKIRAAGRGGSIAHNIMHSGFDEPFRISRIDAQVKIAGESAGDTAR